MAELASGSALQMYGGRWTGDSGAGGWGAEEPAGVQASGAVAGCRLYTVLALCPRITVAQRGVFLPGQPP